MNILCLLEEDIIQNNDTYIIVSVGHKYEVKLLIIYSLYLLKLNLPTVSEQLHKQLSLLSASS